MHHGKIGVHSDGEGLGSKFYFEIPIVRVARMIRDVDSPSVSVEIRPEGQPSDSDFPPPSLSRRQIPRDTLIPSMHGGTNFYENDATSTEIRSLRAPLSAHSLRSGRTFMDSYFDNRRSGSVKSSLWTLDLVQDAGRGPDSLRQLIADKTLMSTNAIRDAEAENRRMSQETVASLTWKPRLLIVDDSRLNRKMMCRLLSNRSEVCDEAEDGLDAVKMVEQAMKNDTAYDIILMDYMMPIMDGPTAAKEIIALGFTGTIIGVTGNALPQDVNVFLTHGASQVIIKPFDVQIFDDLVRGK